MNPLHTHSLLLILLSGATSLVASCVASSPPPEGQWVRVSRGTYQIANPDGSISIRTFGDAARGAHAAYLDSVATQQWAPMFESVRDAMSGDVELISPDSVVSSGTTCGNYSIDHSTWFLGVGAASLLAIAQSTVTGVVFSPARTISSVDHFDSASITPTALAGNPTPVMVSTSATQTPGTPSFGTPVAANASWTDASHFQNANLCSASTSTTIVVHFTTGDPCMVTQTTTFPQCVAVR